MSGNLSSAGVITSMWQAQSEPTVPAGERGVKGVAGQARGSTKASTETIQLWLATGRGGGGIAMQRKRILGTSGHGMSYFLLYFRFCLLAFKNSFQCYTAAAAQQNQQRQQRQQRSNTHTPCWFFACPREKEKERQRKERERQRDHVQVSSSQGCLFARCRLLVFTVTAMQTV